MYCDNCGKKLVEAFRNLAIPLKELRKTQNELSLLRESTMEAISAQQKLLTH
jgi:hypothetical protein